MPDPDASFLETEYQRHLQAGITRREITERQDAGLRMGEKLQQKAMQDRLTARIESAVKAAVADAFEQEKSYASKN